LGLTWPSQTLRLKRDPVLARAQGVIIMKTPGGDQPMLALPLKVLPGWLFGISANKVRPDLREKILRYQTDAYEALWRAFAGEIVGPTLPAGLAGAELALAQAEAVASLARQQVDLERRYTTMADYMRGHVQTTNRSLQDHEQRLTSLELSLSAGATISEAQAAELALAVKNVGQRLAATGDKAGYQKVYGELYRREGISSYKSLPAARYADVLAWLRQWYDEFSDAGGQ
jgi:hypothetical protein